MQNYVIRPAEKHDLPLLDTALRALSKELGDEHLATIELLEKAGFGPTPAYYALVALNDTSDVSGAAVFSPVMSTTLASTGLFVSDLWVTKAARRSGLGCRLLSHAARFAQTRWGADYLKLAVYDTSSETRRFYNRLGLTPRNGETTMILDKFGLDTLKGRI